MSTDRSANAPMTSPAPVATAAEADKLAEHLIEVMNKLVEVVQQETGLVRAGRLGEAERLAQSKADLARRYVAVTLRLQASRGHRAPLAPDRLAAMRARHDAFRTLLQTNLTVLATAHAVSEGIVRGVSSEIARKSAPQTYGASGQANAPGRGASQPLAVSRVL